MKGNIGTGTFKDIREDIGKIKLRLKERAFFHKQINLELKVILDNLFGNKLSSHLKGVYLKKKELIIEVDNVFFASEIQLNINLIKEKTGFEKILIRIL